MKTGIYDHLKGREGQRYSGFRKKRRERNKTLCVAFKIVCMDNLQWMSYQNLTFVHHLCNSLVGRITLLHFSSEERLIFLELWIITKHNILVCPAKRIWPQCTHMVHIFHQSARVCKQANVSTPHTTSVNPPPNNFCICPPQTQCRKDIAIWQCTFGVPNFRSCPYSHNIRWRDVSVTIIKFSPSFLQAFFAYWINPSPFYIVMWLFCCMLYPILHLIYQFHIIIIPW